MYYNYNNDFITVLLLLLLLRIHTILERGSHIFLTAVKDGKMWKVTNEEGLLVYEPNNLISSTSVVGKN